MSKMKKMEQEYAVLLYVDKPIPYRNLELYPVKVKDYYLFHNHLKCLFEDKKKDLKYIGMPYLKFMIEEFRVHNIMPMYQLALLLGLVLKKEFIAQKDKGFIFKNFDFGYDKNNKPYFRIDKFMYNNNDLEEIKRIICLQQGIIDEEIQIDSELKKFLDKSLKLQEIKNMGDLEDLMCCLAVTTYYSLEYIYELPIRKFNKLLQRVDKLMHYKIVKTGEMSGMVTSTQDTEDWKTDIDYKSKYDSVLMKKEEFDTKFNNAKK